MLAHTWNEKMDIKNWWMSEKLDGVCGYNQVKCNNQDVTPIPNNQVKCNNQDVTPIPKKRVQSRDNWKRDL